MDKEDRKDTHYPLKALKRFLTLFLPLSAVLFLSGCKKETTYIRFIDHFKDKDVVSSPLVNLEENFDKYDLHWSAEEMFFLDSDKGKTWAIPTHSRILGWDDSVLPKGMSVKWNDTQIDFISNFKNSPYVWGWKRIQEFIEPERYAGYKRYKGAILLQKNKYFISPELIIPQGEVSLELVACSQNFMKYLPVASLFLNDELIGEIPIGPYQKYKFIHKVKSGKYKLKIGFHSSITRSLNEEEEELLLDQIKVESSSDMILISSLTDEGNIQGSFTASYYAQPENNILFPNDFNRQSNSMDLRSNEPLKKNIDIGNGQNVVEIIAFAQEINTFLKIWIDDQFIAEKRIVPWQWKSYFFDIQSDERKCDFRVEWQSKKSTELSPEKQISIHRIIIKKSKAQALLSLHKMQNEPSLYDPDIKENPFSVKKKLEIGENTINSFFAPPFSDLKFEVRIPKSAVLQFGYGILNQEWGSEDKRGVNFKIVENSGKPKVLFSKYLDASASITDKIHEEKIDLSAYQGRIIKLHFTTENSSPQEVIGLSFWFNPLIYQNTSAFEKKRPDRINNIILISIDTLRADHLGCYGYKRETSTNIDQLADDGVLFVNTFSHSPSTLPSHMSMLTSLYPINHKLCSMPLGGPLGGSQSLDPSIMTLADILRTKVFSTAAFTGDAQVSAQFGFSKGFDFYQENKGSILHDTAEALYKKAKDWLDKNKDKTFFLFLHTYQTHAPYTPPAPYNHIFSEDDAIWEEADLIKILSERQGKYSHLSEEERQNLISLYDGEIRYTDEKFIKPFIAELKDLDLYDRSMIIFTSDHGEEFYEHGGWEHSHSLYNELLHVPLIIKFPDSKYRGNRIESIARTIDIMPTILEEVEINPHSYSLDGESLTDLIEGKKDTGTTSVGFNFYASLGGELGQAVKYELLKSCIIKENYKLILNESYPERKTSDTFWTFTAPPFLQEKIELYDIEKDPQEKFNLAEQDRNKVQELLELIRIDYQKAKEVQQDIKLSKPKMDKKLEERLRSLGYIR